MPKQNLNRGSNSEGLARQGEKGGSKGQTTKAGMSARARGEAEQGDEPSKQALERMAKTPTLRGKSDPSGKGSGNR